MVLSRKRVACHLQVGDEILPQVEEFKYLGVLFTSEGRMEWEIDRRIGAASAVMRTLYRSVVVKKELSRKAKLSIYRSIFVPTLTYGHELWVVTERTRCRIQAAEMSFLRRVSGLSLRDRVRSSVIREDLRVEPLLLRIERSQMRWLGHLIRMPPGRLPGEVFRTCPTGRRPRGRPRSRWRDYILRLAWERLGIPTEELDEVAGEREVWASLLKLLPPRPDPDKRKRRPRLLSRKSAFTQTASADMNRVLVCVLTAALSLGNGQQTVHQLAGDVHAVEGARVTLDCSFGRTGSDDYIFWYKQQVNAAPDFVLSNSKFSRGKTEKKYADRFRASMDASALQAPLHIESVKLSDSAVYYCALQPTLTHPLACLYKNTCTRLVPPYVGGLERTA
ncbi:uncharacterized protein LOC133471975 [Phyllopteryx taeniolatus]|uniref:uncharacterized protein LOC133471975 n=1 Tax=Phyllopteryx taeniolatus TaxID=161469 RepID=UPI002AD47F53|nr:uncharacterized protein LOC133471975 [Phyllopteryx taeniolatus]